MVSWLIGALVLLGILLFLAILRVRHKMTWVLITVVLLFLIFSYLAVFGGKKVDVSSTEGINAAVKSYLSWLGVVWGNTKTVTGNVVNMNWQTNETNQSKK